MALGKNLPRSAQSDSFYYLLITLLLQAGELSNLRRPAGRRVEEEVVFPALRDKRPSQDSENVQHLCILTRLYFLLFQHIKSGEMEVFYSAINCALKFIFKLLIYTWLLFPISIHYWTILLFHCKND